MKTKNNNSVIKIKTLLWVHGLDVSKLARCIGKSRTWTSQVLYGHRKSDATRRAIADILGLTVAEIWPNNNNNRKAT